MRREFDSWVGQFCYSAPLMRHCNVDCAWVKWRGDEPRQFVTLEKVLSEYKEKFVKEKSNTFLQKLSNFIQFLKKVAALEVQLQKINHLIFFVYNFAYYNKRHNRLIFARRYFPPDVLHQIIRILRKMVYLFLRDISFHQYTW